MAIEQTNPDKPKFGVVVICFCVTLLIVLVLAVLFVDFDGKHITFRQHPRGVGSMLLLPSPERRLAA